jgi:hypothetical protein
MIDRALQKTLQSKVDFKKSHCDIRLCITQIVDTPFRAKLCTRTSAFNFRRDLGL